jgi:hypothetical protein
MNREERRDFVARHRTAIVGYGRRQDGPAMTVVYYVLDGDDILVSTMAARAKARAVRHDQKVSLCVLDEQWPLTYLHVYCDAKVETDHDAAVDLSMRIAGVMAGNPKRSGASPSETCRLASPKCETHSPKSTTISSPPAGGGSMRCSIESSGKLNKAGGCVLTWTDASTSSCRSPSQTFSRRSPRYWPMASALLTCSARSRRSSSTVSSIEKPTGSCQARSDGIR